jgi:16S rRNA (guanine527-N7)-methyltransferase
MTDHAPSGHDTSDHDSSGHDGSGHDPALVAALTAIQARGAIGEASIERAIEHALHYVRRIPADVARLADLGSGGGLPGLVIAVWRPDVAVMLVERRHTRADLLRRAVASLDLEAHVEVLADDVAVLMRTSPASFDVVTARSFAAPAITARCAATLLRSGGLLVVSEPPEDDPDRWPADLLQDVGLVDEGRDGPVRIFRRT